MARTRFWVCVHCDLDLGDMTFGQGHNTSLGHGQLLCEIQCNLSIPNLIYSEILFNPNKLFAPNVFKYLLHIKIPCVFGILYIPKSEQKNQVP